MNNLIVGEKLILVCQEVIGEVVNVNNELNKVVIRAEKDGEKFDFIVTTEGFLPFSETPMVEKINFVENEIAVKKELESNFQIGVIRNIRLLNKNRELKLVADFTPLESVDTSVIEIKKLQKVNELHEICKASIIANNELENYMPGN